MKTFTAYCAGKVIAQVEAPNSVKAGEHLSKNYLYPESIVLVNKEAGLKRHSEGKDRSILLADDRLTAGQQISLLTVPADLYMV
jgi:hypothetical protein